MIRQSKNITTLIGGAFLFSQQVL
ncbi:Hypothetical protein SSCIU_00926 [Mammaliicoccus sciuri]|nr:Hypothetical protein SSCIU_00926 [Mammaliicoccus sciuri]